MAVLTDQVESGIPRCVQGSLLSPQQPAQPPTVVISSSCKHSAMSSYNDTCYCLLTQAKDTSLIAGSA